MILLNIKLDNIYGFFQFEIGFSYPKNIASSIVENEFLPDRPNFRYRKVIVLMGANAAGKGCLGKALQYIMDFINTGDTSVLGSLPVSGETGSFSIDFVNERYVLHRIEVQIIAANTGHTYNVKYSNAEIALTDSYESCSKKLVQVDFVSIANLKKYVGNLDYTFSDLETNLASKILGIDQQIVLRVLKAVLGTLDPSLQDVFISNDLRNTFIVRRGHEEIIIQKGKLLNGDTLLRGTVDGVNIAFFLAHLMVERSGLYYCDGLFSNIESSVECKIFAFMLEYLERDGQMIFTSHNTDLLDLNLPKHSFAFLRREYKLENIGRAVYASDLLKQSTDFVRCAFKSDKFAALPNEALLDDLATETGPIRNRTYR